MSAVKSCNSSNSSLFSSSSVLFLRRDTASRLAKYATARNPKELLRNHRRMVSKVGAATEVLGILPLYTRAVVNANDERQSIAVRKVSCRENKILATMMTSRYSEVKLLSCSPVAYTMAVIIPTSQETCSAPSQDASGSKRTRIRCRMPMVIHKIMMGRK